jgi:hypothetical protein
MGNLNKLSYMLVASSSTRFTTSLLTTLLLGLILRWGIVINFKALLNEKLKTHCMTLKLQGS